MHTNTNTNANHAYMTLYLPALRFLCSIRQRLAIGRPTRLRVKLNPPILHVILPSPKPIVRALRQPHSRLDMAGEGAGNGISDFAEGVGEEDVGDWEVGAQDATEGFEYGHDS